MNAAIFYGPNNIQIKNINLMEKKDYYLLKVLSCSICSYDTRTFRNGNFKVIPPIILGHEICAQTINDYSKSGISLKSESRVSIYPITPCLNCWYCTHKNYNLCSSLQEIGSTLNGGFSEYILVPKISFDIGGIIPVQDNITDEEASLIEPLACCINSIDQIKNLVFESVIILGDGPIGLMQLMLIKKLFNVNVTVVGKVIHRLDLAKKLGADLTILFQTNEIEKDDPFKEYNQSIKEINDEYSPNVIFVSNNDPLSLNLALNLVNRNGKIVLFSGIKNQIKYKDRINIDSNFIHYNQISIFGSFSSTPDNMKIAMDMVNSKEINLKSLITDKFSLFNIKDAFSVSESYTGFKSIINEF